MKLYHYTCREYLDNIRATGLWKGEVCTDSWQKIDRNAVWLTTDNNPAGHGLCNRQEIDEDFSRTIFERSGIVVPIGGYFPDKRAVQITVDIHANDTRLFRWIRWASRNVHPVIRDSLIRSGGGMAKARTWYVYFGVILPEEFTSVDVTNELPSIAKAA